MLQFWFISGKLKFIFTVRFEGAPWMDVSRPLLLPFRFWMLLGQVKAVRRYETKIEQEACERKHLVERKTRSRDTS